MTNKPPPQGRPPRPDPYRPSDERGRPPQPRAADPYFDQTHPPRDGGRPVYQQDPYAPAPVHPSRAGSFPAQYGRQPPQRGSSGFGSVIFYSVLGLIAMAAGGAAFAVMALPANFVRDRVVLAVKEKTGRDLVIAGPASFSLYPTLGISLADVSLSAGPGFAGSAPLVTMKALDVSVAFWPLLQRDVRVSSLVLRDPVFTLEVDANGHRSWDFAEADASEPRVRFAQAEGLSRPDAPISDAAPNALPRKPSMLRVSDVKLEDVRIDNGTLNWRDQRTGSTSEFSAINLKLALAAMSEPLTAAGHLDWKGKTVRFDGALTSPADVADNRPAKLKLVLGADALDATFDGSAKLKGDLSAEGILSAKSASTRALAAWFGSDLPPSQGFGPLKAKGLFRGAPDQLSFSTAEIELDRTTARGDIKLDTRGARPMVTAALKLTELDLNLYSSEGARDVPPPRSPAAGAAPVPPPAKTKATSIDDLLQESEAPAAVPGPRVKGFTKRDGWGDEPLRLAALGSLDANARLSIGKLTVSTVRLDQSDVTVALKDRIMTTTLNDVRLYQGTGRGTITLDGTRGTTAHMSANVQLDGIEALPLLKDTAEFDRLTGKGRLSFAVAGQGATERQIIGTLNGKVDVAFNDGAIVGINVAEMLRGVGKGKFGGLSGSPTDKTDFSEMTSTWTLTSGVAENKDLKLVSPLLRVGGAGRIALPPREVDYMLRPKLVASLQGQGGGADALSGLEIPVRVHGPWDNPAFTPDLSAVLKDPDKAMETIKEIGGNLKGKNANEIVDSLIGGTKEERKAKKAQGKKLLEQFLNPQ
ncbi:AsmA family protein [Hyphomicrobium sp.]|uniref:AsmA family protein n=1 Tax=Hyphomicrobium sp. TaxID=82 RepID=UPI003F71F6BE